MKRSLLALAIPFLSVVCIAQDNLVQTANQFINSLTTVQQKKVQYSFTDEERFNWHFVPRTDRKGIPLEELSEQQKKAGFDLLGTCLSKQGMQNVTDIIQLESILKTWKAGVIMIITAMPVNIISPFLESRPKKASGAGAWKDIIFLLHFLRITTI
jgi:hypothetical protein